MSGDFTKKTTITFVSSIIILAIGLATSITLARILGPEGKGIYTLAVLLPALIVTFTNLGIGSTTVYHVAQGRYSRREILGNNILFAFGVGAIGIFIGLAVVFFFQQSFFPGVTRDYLLIALALIPLNLLFSCLHSILAGAQKFKEFNLVTIINASLFLIFVMVALLALKIGITGALFAGVLAWFLTNVVLFIWTWKIVGEISFKLNHAYIKSASSYGVKAHIGNSLNFLNYRIDMFLVNGFLNPAAVGFYVIAVVLVEKLWLVSQTAGTVLLPRVAAEKDDQRHNEFTPLVTRTVFWVTMLGALVIFFLGPWIIELLFSAVFLPAVQPLQILLPGIVALSVWRTMANDIIGRGLVMLNAYIAGVALVLNIFLNILWIPQYGIAGAAWATTISYGCTLVVMLFYYCRFSSNPWQKMFLPQSGDWLLYRQAGLALFQWVKARTLLWKNRIE